MFSGVEASRKENKEKIAKKSKKILALMKKIIHNAFIRPVDAVGNQPAPPQVLTVAGR
jgi:hypothetical protein